MRIKQKSKLNPRRLKNLASRVSTHHFPKTDLLNLGGSKPMMIFFCNTIILFGFLLSFPVILPLILTSKKRRKTILQRLGFNAFSYQKIKKNNSMPDHRPVWIHALSVGETLASVQLVKTLKKSMPHRKIYFSVSTATGYDEAGKHLSNETDTIFFYPYDLLFVVRKILRRVSPSLFILVESDIWPTFLLELNKMNIPAILVNARLSSSSFIGYKRLPWIMKPVLNSFSRICVQSVEQGNRFLQIGVKPDKICITGNIKFDKKTDHISEKNIVSIRKSLAISESKKILLAGSTHPGEESILLESFVRLKSKFSDLHFIIVPRNPDRADEICRLASLSGLAVKKMSQEKTDFSDVVVVDSMGILSKLYAIADVAFVGGSLAEFGGHNPLEPAAFEKPIIFGPDMSNFPEISQMLLEAGGAIVVHNAEHIYQSVLELLNDPIIAQGIGKKGSDVFQANQGAVEKTVAVIKEIETGRKRYFRI
jgi:3-deoxy-D-manno-octulosonic-acid transferase